MNYFKVYHYSSVAGLSLIDPEYYGTGVARGSECKYGKKGLNKSYFYTFDFPEPCVVSKNRYEIYIPSDWYERIYDIGTDPLNLYEAVRTKFRESHFREPYAYEWSEGVESAIKQLGFKGWRNTKFTQLPHCVVLFYALSTHKPKDAELIFDCNHQVIEDCTENLIPYTRKRECFFKSAESLILHSPQKMRAVNYLQSK